MRWPAGFLCLVGGKLRGDIRERHEIIAMRYGGVVKIFMRLQRMVVGAKPERGLVDVQHAALRNLPQAHDAEGIHQSFIAHPCTQAR